jgi:hypothetical protein
MLYCSEITELASDVPEFHNDSWTGQMELLPAISTG